MPAQQSPSTTVDCLVDDIFEDLMVGHNFDYASKEIKKLFTKYFSKQEVEAALQAAEKGSESPGRDNACAEIRALLGLERGKNYA